jgi:hypothetical protein
VTVIGVERERAGKEQRVGLVAFIGIVLFQFHHASSSERYFPTPVAWGSSYSF